MSEGHHENDRRYALVITAGGMATRALVLTGYGAKPKCLVNAGTDGATVLDEIVREASQSGIGDILVIVASERDRAVLERFFHPLEADPDLETYLRRRRKYRELEFLLSRPRMRTRYVVQTEARGFGDAIGLTHPLVREGDETGAPFDGVVVALGDDLIHSSVPGMRQLISAHRATRGMVVAVQDVTQEAAKQFGVVTVEPTPLDLGTGFLGRSAYRVMGVEEKPSAPTPNIIARSERYLAIVGRYVLNPEDVEFLSQGRGSVERELDFTSLLHRNISAGRLTAAEIQGTWFSVGTPLEAQKAFLYYALVPQSDDVSSTQRELAFFVRKLLS